MCLSAEVWALNKGKANKQANNPPSLQMLREVCPAPSQCWGRSCPLWPGGWLGGRQGGGPEMDCLRSGLGLVVGTESSGTFKLFSVVSGSLLCFWESLAEVSMEEQRGEGSLCSLEARMGVLERDTRQGSHDHWKATLQGSPGAGAEVRAGDRENWAQVS